MSNKNEMAGHLACTGGRIVADCVWCNNLRDRDHTGDQGIEAIIILKWISSKKFGRAWAGLLWLRTEITGGLL